MSKARKFRELKQSIYEKANCYQTPNLMVYTQSLSEGGRGELPQAGIAVTKYLSTKEETLGKKENSKLFLLLLTSHLGLKQHLFTQVRKGVGTFKQSFQHQ